MNIINLINTEAIEAMRDAEAPLYHQYPRECMPQPAYIEMDEDGVVSAEWDVETANAVPMAVWNSRTLRFPLRPNISGHSLYDLVMGEKVMGLLERIHAGHTVAWDGNNNSGSLDDDAIEAQYALERLLDDAPQDIEVWEAAEWLFSTNTLLATWDGKKGIDEVVSDCEVYRDVGSIIIGDLKSAILDEAHQVFENEETGLTDLHLSTLVEAGRITQDQADSRALPDNLQEIK